MLRPLSRFYSSKIHTKIIKVDANSSSQPQEYIQITASSQKEIFEFMNSSPELQKIYEQTISNIPELQAKKHEITTLMEEKSYLNPNGTVKNNLNEKVLKDNELQQLRNEMGDLLLKYGILMPESNNVAQQTPLALFGPPGKKAIVLGGSVPGERIGLGAASVKDDTPRFTKLVNAFAKLFK